jgi:hypothetical protein
MHVIMDFHREAQGQRERDVNVATSHHSCAYVQVSKCVCHTIISGSILLLRKVPVAGE